MFIANLYGVYVVNGHSIFEAECRIQIKFL